MTRKNTRGHTHEIRYTSIQNDCRLTGDSRTEWHLFPLNRGRFFLFGCIIGRVEKRAAADRMRSLSLVGRERRVVGQGTDNPQSRVTGLGRVILQLLLII